MRQKKQDQQLFTLRGLQFWLYATNVLVPFLPIYFQKEGYSSSQIGLLMMTGPLLAVFFQPFWGYLSDRLQTVKKIVFLLWGLTILSSIGLFHSTNYAVTLLFISLLYVFWQPSLPLMDSITIKAAERRGSTYGSIRLFGSLGFTAVSLAGGGVLALLGGIMHLSYLYWATWIVPMLLLLFLKDEPSEGERMSLSSLKPIVHNKSFLWFLVLIFLISVPHRMNDVMLGLYMKESGASDSMVGWAWALAAAAEIPAFAILSRYLKKIHEFTLIGLVGIVFSIRWLMYALVTDPWLMLALQAGAAVTFAVFWIASVHYTARVLPKQLSSTGQSLLAMVFLGFAGITGGGIGGWFNDHYGGASMYIFASIASLLAGLAFLISEFVSRRRSFQRADQHL